MKNNCEQKLVVDQDTVSYEELSQYIELTQEERKAIEALADEFPLKVSRYFAEQIKNSSPNYPLRKMVIPHSDELIVYPDDAELSLHADESQYQPVEGLIHRYPGKVLFFPVLDCFANCRFCYRKEQQVVPLIAKEKVDAAIEYIENTNEIRDVIITGGDPFILSNEKLDELVGRIRAISHVEIIRIGTRVLTFAPERIDDDLVDRLAKHSPLIVKNSYLHADEMTFQSAEACRKLAERGIMLFQQGPVLKGINDSTDELKRLYETLIKNRVIPYYAGFGVYAKGARHFLLQEHEVVDLMQPLENNTSGFCIPTLLGIDHSNGKVRYRV